MAGEPATTAASARLEARAPACPESIPVFRQGIAAYAAGLGADQRVIDDVRLAVSEALTNVVVHAYSGTAPGMIMLESWHEDDHLRVVVCDDGAGLVPRADSPGLGLGMGIMAQAADEFAVANRDGHPGTVVELCFSLAGAR